MDTEQMRARVADVQIITAHGIMFVPDTQATHKQTHCDD